MRLPLAAGSGVVVRRDIDEDEMAPGGKGGFAILSDEGALFGADSLAPYPLQYFLAGIAF